MHSRNWFDSPMLQWTEGQFVTPRQMCTGTACIGATGGGKSSTYGKTCALALLSARPKAGGLILAAKPDDASTWMEYARLAGRSEDVILFNGQSDHVYDPLAYEWNRPGRSRRDLESILDIFETLAALGRSESDSSADRFWTFACAQLQRNIVTLLALAGEPISISNLSRAIDGLPSRVGECADVAWQEASYMGFVLGRIRERQTTLTQEEWDDLDVALRYVTQAWPSLDERPRSSIYFTWSGLANRFQFNPLSRLFSSGRYTFTPESVTEDSKLVICDYPALEYGLETSRIATCLVKLSFMRAFLRRDVNRHPGLTFMFSDEASMYILPKGRDEQFLAVCRGARVAVIYLFQNLNGLASAHGEAQVGSRTKSLLASLTTKVFMANSDVETNKWAAETIGKEWASIRNIGVGGASASAGETEHHRYRLDAEEFTRLVRPSGSNPLAEAIVYAGGEIFHTTKSPQHPQGLPYLRVAFTRE